MRKAGHECRKRPRIIGRAVGLRDEESLSALELVTSDE
jgi:hypothetical protein